MELGTEADDRTARLIAVLGVAATAIGVAWLEPSNALGFGRDLGFLAQLSTTVPAAVLVLGAFAANVAAGAVLVGLAMRQRFPSGTEAALAGLAGAVALDAVLLFGLGAAGWFRLPVLVAVHVVILGIGLWRRSELLPAVPAVPRPSPLWWLVLLPFAGAVLLQLASPVVPFLDVLPNHVAPVEHLRTFGAYASLDTMPSPIYGPSRAFLGYTAMLGVVATMTGLPAALAVAASILPQALLVALGVRRLARSLGGPGTEVWALLAFLLTASFGRLTDARANVLVLPLIFWLLARFHEATTTPRENPEEAQTERTVESIESGRLIGLGLGAALLVHPLMGLFAAAVIGLVSVVDARRAADVGVHALAIGGALALPQLATTLGLSVPSWAGLLAVPAAVGADVAIRRLPFIRDTVVWAGWIGLLAAVPAGLVFADPVLRAIDNGVGPVLSTMPLLVVAAGAGFVLARLTAAAPVVVAGLAVGAAVGTFAQLVPDGDLLGQTIHFELPKELDYWLPAVAVFPAAIGLTAVLRGASLAQAGRARLALVALFVVTAALPIRTTAIDDHHRGEHRFSEAIAIDLRWAVRGYWRGYPDPRRILGPQRQALIDAIRAEIATEQIGPTTPVLHVAQSFQQWVATPLGVFSGVIETDVTPDAVVEIHTIGGRLVPLTELGALLAGGRFPVVVLEPVGLDSGIREAILAAGYVSTFRNTQGELFVRQYVVLIDPA